MIVKLKKFLIILENITAQYVSSGPIGNALVTKVPNT